MQPTYLPVVPGSRSCQTVQRKTWQRKKRDPRYIQAAVKAPNKRSTTKESFKKDVAAGKSSSAQKGADKHKYAFRTKQGIQVTACGLAKT